MAVPPERDISVARFTSQVLGVVAITVAAVLGIRALGFDPWQAEAQAEATAWFDQSTAIEQRNWLDSEADLGPVSDIVGSELVRTALNVEMTGRFRGQNVYGYEWSATGVSPSGAQDICDDVAEHFQAVETACDSLPATISPKGSPQRLELTFEFDEAAGTVKLSYEPS